MSSTEQMPHPQPIAELPTETVTESTRKSTTTSRNPPKVTLLQFLKMRKEKKARMALLAKSPTEKLKFPMGATEQNPNPPKVTLLQFLKMREAKKARMALLAKSPTEKLKFPMGSTEQMPHPQQVTNNAEQIEDLFYKTSQKRMSESDPSQRTIGITNPKNQCYSISVLQMLRCAPDFIKTFTERLNEKLMEFSDLTYTQPTYSPFDMSMAFVNLNRAYQNILGSKVVDLSTFQDVRFHCFQLSHSKQECAAEFLDLLLTRLKDETGFDDLFETNFQLKMEEELTCTACGVIKVNDEEYQVRNLTLSVDHFHEKTLNEVVHGDSRNWGMTQKVHCPICKGTTNFTSTRVATNRPRYLLFHLKRFEHVVDTRSVKRFERITIPLDYEMTVTKEGQVSYGLKAIIIHIGLTLELGHYIIYIKSGSAWVCCDDHEIYKVNYDEIVEKVERYAYIVMYARKD